jgi:benzoate/toluate 1,2-dioxygenase beta subunit
MSAVPAPATTSYVDEAFYKALLQNFAGWEQREIADASVREQCRMLLEREARYLDQWRLEDWLALFSPQCAYWVPGRPGQSDPRREVMVAFDDRRRLEDRVYRLRSGNAWSQTPPSRTVRMVSNVEVFDGGSSAALMVRSNFLITEFRAGETRQLAGWCAHRLGRRNDGWEIEVKQVNLIDCDQNLRNPSLIF